MKANLLISILVFYVLISKKILLSEPVTYTKIQNENVAKLIQTSNKQKLIEETFDFIVIGAGSAGSVVANRLSENKNWNILLLEAGEQASSLTDIPVLAPFFQFTNYSWHYLTEKQDNVGLGFNNQKMSWPRGRALGGSSVINYMIYMRGNPQDYNQWADNGNPGWSYKDVLPYFIKSENSLVKNSESNFHGTKGFLTVSDVPFRSESAHVWIKASQEAGYKYLDYNGKHQLGVSYIQTTTQNGRRCSAETAFLKPIKQRTNLKILTNSRVTKILIDSTTKTAYGVEFYRNHKKFQATVKREIVLSAGVFNSAQLLMLSGVGPKNHLQNLDIQLIKDLPVGRKLYDHITFYGLVIAVNASIVCNVKSLFQITSVIDFLIKGNGPLTSIGGIEAVTMIKTNISEGLPTYPDVELLFLCGGIHIDKGLLYKKVLRITDKIYDAVWKPLEDKYAFTIPIALLRSKSYGQMNLKSKNPFHWPTLYGGYFTDPKNHDIKALIASIREAQRIIKQPAFQKHGATQVDTPIPGCEHLIFDTDIYWECALRHLSTSLYHQTSTCKMGPKNDPEAVVDNELKVYGIQNLRVVDTSIIPIPLVSHTNAPAYMIAEKASDLIKNHWLINESQN